MTRQEEVSKTVERALRFVDGLKICESCGLYYHPDFGPCSHSRIDQTELKKSIARLQNLLGRLIF